MEKRFILAIALSLLVLLSWSAFVSKGQHIDNKEVTNITPSSTNIPPPSTSSPELLKQEAPESSSWQFTQEVFEIIFNESQASIKEVIFNDYRLYRFPLKYGFFLGDRTRVFQKERVEKGRVDFVCRDKDMQITKRFILSNYNYNIGLEIEIQNLSSGPLKVNLPLVLGVLDFSRDKANARFQDVTIATQDKISHFNARSDIAAAGLKFLGLRDRYFCVIIEPVVDNYTGFIRKINAQESEVGLSAEEILLSPNQQIEQKFRIYLGPQDLKLINRIQPRWSAVVHYGSFDFISQMLLQLLDFLYRLVHNWGWAVIILSFVVYLILYPLTLKQMRSMKEMQVLQPQIEQLRKLYKDNPQKLNKEILELYRQHKVNPLGGCLPLILQIPIFFALYQALMRSVVLKGANFLWIKDLSEPDRLFILPRFLPIIGNEINILPIIMAIGMFIQQKLSLSATKSGSSEQQKLMIIIFPLMFGFIFYHMPSGLVLYWLTNSTLMLLYQFRITHKK